MLANKTLHNIYMITEENGREDEAEISNLGSKWVRLVSHGTN